MIIIKVFLLFILCVIFPFCMFSWLLAMIWMLTPFVPCKKFCHWFFGWHKPDGKYKYYPKGVHRKCMICGCDIISDGANGWQKINLEKEGLYNEQN